MNPVIESLKARLREQNPNYGYTDARSLMDMLYFYYTEQNPVDNAVIRCQYRELDRVMDKLTWAENETVFRLTAELCASYEKQAFLDGMEVGLRLFVELQDLRQKELGLPNHAHS